MGGDGHAVSSEVAKGLDPRGTERRERIILEKTRVETIGIINIFVQMLERSWGFGRSLPQGLKKSVESNGPETGRYVVFLGNGLDGERNGG
jgi:hypothetical protein